MKLVEYWEMDYHELDGLITSTYGLKVPYEMVAYEELNNDTSWTADLKKEPVDEWHEADMKAFKATGKIGNWRTRWIMQDMVNNDVLPEGNYVVEVSW